MSRFTDKPIQSGGAIGATASGLLLEKFGRLFDRYLLRAHPPARLKAAEAADLLGFHEDDMTILVRQKLIQPLGDPAHNSVKYFALVDVEELGRGRDGLSVATKSIYGRNRGKSGDGCAQELSEEQERDYLIEVN
jgi:hypothetical protein